MSLFNCLESLVLIQILSAPRAKNKNACDQAKTSLVYIDRTSYGMTEHIQFPNTSVGAFMVSSVSPAAGAGSVSDPAAALAAAVPVASVFVSLPAVCPVPAVPVGAVFAAVPVAAPAAGVPVAEVFVFAPAAAPVLDVPLVAVFVSLPA